MVKLSLIGYIKFMVWINNINAKYVVILIILEENTLKTIFKSGDICKGYNN